MNVVVRSYLNVFFKTIPAFFTIKITGKLKIGYKVFIFCLMMSDDHQAKTIDQFVITEVYQVVSMTAN